MLALEHFWADKGCLIWQPYYSQVGAGTMNPATFLRVLGPEPWNVAYVQPSRRPKDGRYGENPNRLQHYYQYQVIMKPSPYNVQNQYLDSLKALGIDTLEHDIRFVEDDWESPTLGASGLGWEVWLDGMEITQSLCRTSIRVSLSAKRRGAGPSGSATAWAGSSSTCTCRG